MDETTPTTRPGINDPPAPNEEPTPDTVNPGDPGPPIPSPRTPEDPRNDPRIPGDVPDRDEIPPSMTPHLA